MSARKPSINFRQKTLVGLLGAFGGHVPNRDFQKYLFLYTQEYQKTPDYEFVPYKYGGFSFQSYADKRRLAELSILSNSDNWLLQDQSYGESPSFDEGRFNDFYARYSGLKGDQLIRDVYRRYPYYAINSEIAARLMNVEEISRIERERTYLEEPCFFTIGYEGSSFEGYLNRLIRNGIKTLVDVRCNPLSRKYGFSKKTLSDVTQKLGIEYIHIPELGIASEKRQKLNTQADYDRLFDSYEKVELKNNSEALNRLFKIFLERKRVAITCFEAQACMCHRNRVAKAISNLQGWRYNIRHI